MKINLEGTEIDCGNSAMAGRSVGEVIIVTMSAILKSKPSPGEDWIVVNDLLSDVDWIVVFKDGFELSRIRLESVSEVGWREPIA